MHSIEILLIFVLVAFTQGTIFSQFPNWQSSWIEGGSDAFPGEFPYMVSLRDVENNENDCGGSIINNWYILTAAHCFYGSTTSSIIVVVGTNKLNLRGQRYGVSRYITHSDFHPSSYANDIGLIKLKKPVVYSARVQPITLPKQNEKIAAGMSCSFMGWGITSPSASSPPNNLQKLQLNIISNTECEVYYGNMFDFEICAAGAAGTGVCVGDSGGALVCGGKQVGINIGGKAGTLCSTPYPSLYVYVPKYIHWIKQHAV